MANVLLLTLYLAAACLALAVISVLSHGGRFQGYPYSSRTKEILARTLFGITAGGACCVPGAVFWLFAVGRYPTTWSRRRRRVVALATTPIVGIFWILALCVLWVPTESWPDPLIFGILLPLGSGFVVRFRGGAPPGVRSDPSLSDRQEASTR